MSSLAVAMFPLVVHVSFSFFLLIPFLSFFFFLSQILFFFLLGNLIGVC